MVHACPRPRPAAEAHPAGRRHRRRHGPAAQAATGAGETAAPVDTLGRVQFVKGDKGPATGEAATHWWPFWDGLIVAEFGADGTVVSRRLMRCPRAAPLFHTLPGDREHAVRDTLPVVGGSCPPIPLAFPKVRFIGRGMAVEVAAPRLVRL